MLTLLLGPDVDMLSDSLDRAIVGAVFAVVFGVMVEEDNDDIGAAVPMDAELEDDRTDVLHADIVLLLLATLLEVDIELVAGERLADDKAEELFIGPAVSEEVGTESAE